MPANSILCDSDIVEGKLDPGKGSTFVHSNISRGAAGNGVMVTGCVNISVRIGGNVWGKERESEERKRGRETHPR